MRLFGGSPVSSVVCRSSGHANPGDAAAQGARLNQLRRSKAWLNQLRRTKAWLNQLRIAKTWRRNQLRLAKDRRGQKTTPRQET